MKIRVLLMAIALLMSVGATSQKLGQTYKEVFQTVSSQKDANYQAYDFSEGGNDYRSIIDISNTKATHFNFHAKSMDNAPLVNIIEFYKKSPEGQRELDNRIKLVKSLEKTEDGLSYKGKANGVPCVIKIEKTDNKDPTFQLFWLKEFIVVTKL